MIRSTSYLNEKVALDKPSIDMDWIFTQSHNKQKQLDGNVLYTALIINAIVGY